MKLWSEMLSTGEERNGKKIETDACMRPAVLSPPPGGAFPGGKVCRSGRLDVSIGAPADASDHDELMPGCVANGTFHTAVHAHKHYRFTPLL